jgi:exopolyphosphatase/guanosine-5'-triphosphate,3'-diphosphate pyrophosphatase
MLRPLEEQQRTIRLGEGVDANGVLSEAAVERLIEALQEFQVIAGRWNVERYIVVGTSASRDAGNALSHTVRERTGLHYAILSGEEEADLSFAGAIAGLPRANGNLVTCDIGGGSTEIVRGTSQGVIHECLSLNIGSVRITERFFSCQPPKPRELEAAERFIRKLFADTIAPEQGDYCLVGTSDTHRLLLDLQRALVSGKIQITTGPLSTQWERLRKTGKRARELSLSQVRGWMNNLVQMDESEVLALNPGKLKGRSDVFPAACMICFELMHRLTQRSITISKWGLRHGVGLKILRDGTLRE